MKVISFKADPDDHERWKKFASLRQMTFGALARESLNERVTGVRPPTSPVARDLPKVIPPLKNLAKAVKGKCPHRIPEGTWCKTCGKTK